MKTRRAYLIVCVLTALGFVNPAIHAADKPPIKIGVILPLSGFQASYGEMYRAVFNMAVEDINKAGGVNGSSIQLVVEDDQGTATQAVLLFRRLVADGVVAMLGPIAGTTWEQAAPLANSLKTPALNWTALKPKISLKPYALRLQPADDSMIPEGVAEFHKKFPNAKKIVIAGDLKEASGASGVEEFKKAVAKQGLQLIEIVGFDTRTTDFSPVAIKINGLAPDAVFLSAFPNNATPLLNELEALGFNKPVLGNALLWAAGAFVQTVGASGRNVYSIGYNTNELAPSIKGHDEFSARFIKYSTENSKLPQPANVANTTLAYDTIVLLTGIMRSKKIDGATNVEKVRDAIKDSLASLKQWQGFSSLVMTNSGDGYIRTHLLEIDLKDKIWKFSLPLTERQKK